MFYVYLMASRKQGTLYLGVTNNLVRRAYEHKNRVTKGFTAQYGVDRLVWNATMIQQMQSSAKRNSRSGGAHGRSN